MSPEFVVLYRWRIAAGFEDEFADAWSSVTRTMLTRGSLGSRLHRSDDDTFYAYAQWPSAAARDAAFLAPDGPSPASATMARLIVESFPEIHLHLVADLLVHDDEL